MKVYLVIVVFKGILDEVHGFRTPEQANEKQAQLHRDHYGWIETGDIDISVRTIEV